MTAMTKGELSSFLNRGTFMAKLPIVKEDGSPHVVPLWFVLDAEDNIIFGTATNSVKGKNISCDPSIPNNFIHGHSYLCYTSPKSRC